jgi:hypothetical protein
MAILINNQPTKPLLGSNANPALLMRHLILDVDGTPLFDDDVDPERWAEMDQIEPTLCRLADMRVALLSISVDESRVRAAYEIDNFKDSPVGPTEPRMGDFVVLQIGTNTSQSYRVELTHGVSMDDDLGDVGDVGENELILSLVAMVVEHE